MGVGRGIGVLLGLLALWSCAPAGNTVTLPNATTPETGAPGDSTPATLVPTPLEGQLRLDRESEVVLEGLVISNPDGDCIRITRSSGVVIRGAIIGPCAGKAVHIEDSDGVTVEDSELFSSSAGVYALDSSSIVVAGNIITSAGRNPIQYDKVTGVGNEVSQNEILNDHGSPHTEDSISIYKSSGTTTSPLSVEGNLLFGGGSSRSGSGIMVGDGGGSHVSVSGNTLINPGQVGIGVAGGDNIRVIGNRVFSQSFPWTNVGIYVWDQYDSECTDVEVSGNLVQWENSVGAANPLYDAGNCGAIEGWELNRSVLDLGESLSTEYGDLMDS